MLVGKAQHRAGCIPNGITPWDLNMCVFVYAHHKIVTVYIYVCDLLPENEGHMGNISIVKKGRSRVFQWCLTSLVA